MYIAELDFEKGRVLIDSAAIAIDEKNTLVGSIAKLCSPPIQTGDGRTRYCLARKVSVCGKSADCVIEVAEGRVCTVTFLFDLIEFFDSSVLESKILKACERPLNISFISDHPSTAVLDSFDWGQATFFYNAKQGDLSLEITFQRSSSEPSLNP